jgi:hypothetical protein
MSDKSTSVGYALVLLGIALAIILPFINYLSQ